MIKTSSKKFTKSEIKNSIFEGDCIHILKQFPDSSIDMVLCDLPYGTTQNKWDSVIPLEELWKEYHRVVKKDGAIVLTSQGIFTAKLILSNEKFFKYKLVWEKSKSTNFLNAKKQPLRKNQLTCIWKRRKTFKKLICQHVLLTMVRRLRTLLSRERKKKNHFQTSRNFQNLLNLDIE